MSIDRILFVTAHPEEWADFLILLQKFGYEVVSSNSGEDALEKLQSDSFTVIICTLHLPDMDGIELCWQARQEKDKALPFVMLIPEQDKELELNCLRSGIDLVFSEPVDFREFRIRLDTFLKRFREMGVETQVEASLFSGFIQEFPLVELIQWLSNLHRSGTLWLTHEFQRAAIVFDHGEVVFARCGTLLGEQALFQVLTWKEGTFHFEKRKFSSESNIQTKTMRLLMEYIGLQDEKSAKTKESSPPEENPPAKGPKTTSSA